MTSTNGPALTRPREVSEHAAYEFEESHRGDFYGAAFDLTLDLLGFLGQTKEVSLEYLLGALRKNRICETDDERVQLLQALDGVNIPYWTTFGGLGTTQKYLKIERYTQAGGRPDFYAISKHIGEDVAETSESGRKTAL